MGVKCLDYAVAAVFMISANVSLDLCVAHGIIVATMIRFFSFQWIYSLPIVGIRHNGIIHSTDALIVPVAMRRLFVLPRRAFLLCQ